MAYNTVVRDIQATGRGFSALLERYRSEAIADACSTNRQVAHSWRSGRSLPDVRFIPILAAFLKIDLAELTQIIADDAAQRAAA
jgi:hypothetical protein